MTKIIWKMPKLIGYVFSASAVAYFLTFLDIFNKRNKAVDVEVFCAIRFIDFDAAAKRVVSFFLEQMLYSTNKCRLFITLLFIYKKVIIHN